MVKKEFIAPGLLLRPVHAYHARPPFQWTLNSVFSAYENNNRRIRPPPDRGTLKIVSRLLLLLSRFSRVRLCMTPEMAVHQAPPSLGFSRQEHWSGLPFPSPMHESEKWKWSRSVISDSWPHGLQPTRLLHPWDFPGKSTGVGCHCLLRPVPSPHEIFTALYRTMW